MVGKNSADLAFFKTKLDPLIIFRDKIKLKKKNLVFRGLLIGLCSQGLAARPDDYSMSASTREL
jgi:hypothetical protein